jgi:hypothetical protein
VPDAVGGRRGQEKRSARIPPHDDRAARNVRGLEGALFDFDLMTIDALDAADKRRFEIAVAGPAALVVAKAHKIRERLSRPKRSNTIAKDALDVVRILRGCTEEDVARRWRSLLEGGAPDDNVRRATSVVAAEAMEFIRAEFAVGAGRGCDLTVRAAAGTEDPDLLRASTVDLARRVLDRLR